MKRPFFWAACPRYLLFRFTRRPDATGIPGETPTGGETLISSATKTGMFTLFQAKCALDDGHQYARYLRDVDGHSGEFLGFVKHKLIETPLGFAANLDQTPRAMLDQVHGILLELIGAKLILTGIAMITHLA